jgi:AcrR family transcriptional regulator
VIDAALDVFSREGWGATTREIARVAGVNEVTLFRQFTTKERLLAEVTRELVRQQSESLDRIDLNDFDLGRDLTTIAEAYDRSTSKHVGFIRTMMAQPVDPKLTEQITREIVRPLREKFLVYLEEARKRGLIRAEVDLSAAVDAFTGMVFAGALRRSIRRQGYSREAYLNVCVEVFLRGLAVSS